MPRRFHPLDRAVAGFTACAPLFHALGDPQRQRIVLLLAQHDELSVNAIADATPLSRPAISHHLKVLKDAGLLGVRREGRENFHYLTIDPALAALRAFVDAAERACS